MARLSIRLLGPLQVTLDGEPVTGFESDKVRALLAYLAVEKGAPQRREKLVGLLWPDWPERAARTNLRRALANLRKSVGDHQATPPFLHISHQAIQFNSASNAWVDVIACQDLLSVYAPQSTFMGLTTSDPQTIRQMEEAVELYHGDFLEGFSLAGCPAFEEWMLFEEERLRRLTLEALDHLSGWYEQQGRTDRALQYARRQVELDPLHESAHRQIMRLLAHNGQRGVALAQYETCRRILAEQLGVGPGVETTALYERIRDEAQTCAPSPVPQHNLPAPLTPFVGRKAELAQIRDRLQDPSCRLLTLVGPGGIGKTRLALESAATKVDDYRDGVFQVRLAGVESAEAIVPTVAQAIGFSFRPDPKIGPREQLLDYLRQKTMLLILDNLEHLLDGADVVPDFLRAAPGVTMLTTSRIKLDMKGEHLFPVTGLAFPEPESSEAPRIALYDAVELFVTSARRVRPGFELGGHERDIAYICRLVQGMPLAILLAAASVEMLSPSEIADRIAQSMDILEANWQDVPERHRSMRAVFDQSWELLSEHEQKVLQALSVFRGGFGQEAARRVAGASMHDLRSLVHKSFLYLLPGRRYDMHELHRQYAAEKLGEAPAIGEAVRDQHCAYYGAALQKWEQELRGSKLQTALAEMDAEIGNARSAWDWALELRHIEWLDQAVGCLGSFYGWHWRLQEGESAFRLAAEELSAVISQSSAPAGAELRIFAKILSWQGALSWRGAGSGLKLNKQLQQQSLVLLDRAELAGEDTRLDRAIVLRRMGTIVYESDSDFEEAERLYEQSLALYRALDDQLGMADGLFNLGCVAWRSGTYGQATKRFEEGLAIAQALGNQSGMADSLRGLGYTAMRQGQLEQGEHSQREALAIYQQVGKREFVASVQMELGSSLLLYSDRFAEGQSLLEEAAMISDDLGQYVNLALSNLYLGAVQSFLGEYEQARAQLQEVFAFAQGIGFPRGLGLSLWLQSWVALAEETHTDAQRLSQESVSGYGEYLQREELAWALSTSGLVFREVGQIPRAKQHLFEALRLGVEIGAPLPLVLALPGIALLLADEGGREEAVELYALASRFPILGNTRLWEDIAGRQIAAIAATLPQNAVTRAQERGRTRDLDATAVELLIQLRG